MVLDVPIIWKHNFRRPVERKSVSSIIPRQVEDLMSLNFDVLNQTEDFLEELVPEFPSSGEDWKTVP